MFRSFTRALTRSLRRDARPRRPGPIRRGRPGVEWLEDRLVPAVINVNSTADILNPGAGVVTLRSAIQQANTNGDASNTINLTVAGTYRISLAGTPGETDNAAGEFAILPKPGTLTIQNTSGSNVAVDANHLSRAFDINPANTNDPKTKLLVVLQGFTIENGYVTDSANADGPNASGGGIRDQGNASLTLTNMVIEHNSATADGGGVVMENTAPTPWTLTVNNSTISLNHAGDAGGGIDADGSGKVFITDSTVSDNSALNQGAGIWLDAILVGPLYQTANLTVTGSTFIGNQALSNGGVGGAIGNAGNGTVTITASTLEDNFAGATGGGFGDENGVGTLAVSTSLIEGNYAVGGGGGIAAGGPSTTITDSELRGNGAGAAGGGLLANSIASGHVTLDIERTTIADNATPTNGGGIELAIAGTGTITDTTIAGNAALNNGGGDLGGGIDMPATFVGTLVLLADTINGNNASAAGGLSWAGASGSSVTLENTIIAGNYGGNTPDLSTNRQTVTDEGGNLIGNGTGGGGFTSRTSQVGTANTPLDAMLGPLQDNLGPLVGAPGTQIALETEMPLTGSPALGKGVLPGAPATDARGLPRVLNRQTDVGAVETTTAVTFDNATQTLTVTGNTVSISQATTADAFGLHSTYTFTVDGQMYTVPGAGLSGVNVAGTGASPRLTVYTNDTYVGTDGLAHETQEEFILGYVNGHTDGGQLLKFNAAGVAGAFMSFANFQQIVAVTGHADLGIIEGTPNLLNVFVGNANLGAYMNTGSGPSAGLFEIEGAGYVYGYAANTFDQAYEYDSAAAGDTYVTSGTSYSFMIGAVNGVSFFNEGVGFRYNYGIANHPGDLAIFYDSPGNDGFVGNTTNSYMYADDATGTNLVEYDSASGFTTVDAYSFVGGSDFAFNHDTNVNHVFGFRLLG